MPELSQVSQRQRSLESLRFAHSMTESLLKDFPEAKACHQPSPTDNHLLWSLGHLAATYAWMLSLIGKPSSLPESYSKLFGWGSKPTPDATAYPPLASVREAMESELAAFLRAIAEMPEAQLSQPLAKDVGKFAKDAIELVDRAAWHEGWHSGQISSLRRSLGLPYLMG
ncbi:MAG TPA: DinB family protein [Phycisphaerales bacterium]|nr:DinB family protein [Phycisphaerales bacterium]